MYLDVAVPNGNGMIKFGLFEDRNDGVIIPHMNVMNFAAEIYSQDDPEIIEAFASGELTKELRDRLPDEYNELINAIESAKANISIAVQSEW